jgi:hypothetical protein
MLLEKRTRLDE